MPHTSPFVSGRGRLLLLFVIMSLVGSTSTLLASNATATWAPNTESDLAGYKLSYGTQSGVYSTTVDCGNVTTWPMTLTAGQRYYFAVQAYNISGLISALSAEVVFNIPASTQLTITGVAPTSGPVGRLVTVSGTNFGTTQGTSAVTVNGITGTPTTWSATSIVVPVPAGATTGNVVVTVGGIASNGVAFTVTTTTTALAQLTTPAPGSTLTASTVTVQWTGGTGVSDYWLTVGTTVGGQDLFSQERGTSLSATVAGLPTNGSTLYVRLFSLISGTWQSNDYTYAATKTTSSGLAQVTTPAPGSTLTASTVTVQWTGGTGVSDYWLTVGTTVGGQDLFSQERGTSLSVTVAGLPTNGSTLYVRLFSLISGTWQSNDYTYTATKTTSSGLAQVTTPAPGSTLTASTVTVQWTGGTGVSDYWLTVGTTVGGQDLFSQERGTSLSATVAGLPADGSTLYVRLFSLISGTWQSNDYTYTAPKTTSSGLAQVTTPAPGSTLTASTVTVQWTGGTGASDYWLTVGTTVGGQDLFSQERGTSLSATVAGLPADGSTLYVRLFSLISGTWQSNDYTYTATKTTSSGLAQVTTPAPGSTLTASTVTVQWTGGTGVSDYWLTVGTTVGGQDLFSQERGTSLSVTVAGLPTNGSTLYVRLFSLISGTWQSNDYTYTATKTTSSGLAQVTTPAPGSTLTASTVTVRWTGGTGVSDYWLTVGTTVGGQDLFSQERGTSLSVTVAGLPTNGSTLYVRLFSLISGTWQYNDYTYTATTK